MEHITRHIIAAVLVAAVSIHFHLAVLSHTQMICQKTDIDLHIIHFGVPLEEANCHICHDANREARWIACNLQCTQLGAQAGGRSTLMFV